MINLNKFVLKVLTYGIKSSVRKIISLLPSELSAALGRLGYTEIIKRSSDVNFVGNVFTTELKIHCQSNYAVERIATARCMGENEPFAGISRLGLKISLC